MARYFLIFTIICIASFGLHVSGVNGTVDAQAEGNTNYSTAIITSNNHGVVYEPQKTGQPPNIGYGKADDTQSVQQLRLIQPARTLKSLNIVKRAPSGFTGLRGKKQNELTENGIDWNSFDWPNSLDQEEAEKEQGEEQLDTDPVTWQNIANTWSPIINGRRFKKTPTAFYGVRGKKLADAGNQIHNLQDLMQQLQAERIRDELMQDFLDRISMSTEYMNAIEKRTPGGFMGMRGKRAMPDFNANDVGSNDDDDNDDGIVHQAFKRSPPNHMSFYGTRGKKQPFVDFRNKFVGVRGKKSSTAFPVQQSLAQNPEQSSELLQLSAAEPNYDGAQPRYLVNMLPLFYDAIYKRTPNGFMGMRGKRATTRNGATIVTAQQQSNLKDSTPY